MEAKDLITIIEWFGAMVKQDLDEFDKPLKNGRLYWNIPNDRLRVFNPETKPRQLRMLEVRMIHELKAKYAFDIEYRIVYNCLDDTVEVELWSGVTLLTRAKADTEWAARLKLVFNYITEDV